jgi:hypothetical protein
MTLTKTNVCQLALDKLGSAVTLSDVDSDATVEAIQCKRHYDVTLSGLLRSHPWNFASVWADLIRDAAAVSGTSSGSNAALTMADTSKTWTTNEFANYYLWITGGTGVDQIRLIASNTNTEILTVTQAFVTVPDDTSTYEIWQYSPPYPWDYQYLLPSDFLRLVDSDPRQEAFEIEGTRVKSDSDSMHVEYVRNITDPTLFDALFVEVMVLALAAKICMPLLRDKTWEVRLQQELAAALVKARLVNRTEENKRHELTWNESRGTKVT